jgi:hypothetical protein
VEDDFMASKPSFLLSPWVNAAGMLFLDGNDSFSSASGIMRLPGPSFQHPFFHTGNLAIHVTY